MTSHPDAENSLSLADLREGDVVTVTGLAEADGFGGDSDLRDTLLARLRDIGFVAGARCEVLARMWFGDPMAVRIGGSTFALRRIEAASVNVQRAPGPVLARAPQPQKDVRTATA